MAHSKATARVRNKVSFEYRVPVFTVTYVPVGVRAAISPFKLRLQVSAGRGWTAGGVDEACRLSHRAEEYGQKSRRCDSTALALLSRPGTASAVDERLLKAVQELPGCGVASFHDRFNPLYHLFPPTPTAESAPSEPDSCCSGEKSAATAAAASILCLATPAMTNNPSQPHHSFPSLLLLANASYEALADVLGPSVARTVQTRLHQPLK